MAINRKLGTDDALDTVHLALQYKSKANGVIVGVDLSGDPQVSDSVPVDRSANCIFQCAWSSFLRIPAHMADIDQKCAVNF